MSEDEPEPIENASNAESVQEQNAPEEQDVPMQTDDPSPDAEEQHNRASENDFFKHSACIEVARCSWDRPVRQNYLQGCHWSPDGTCVLTTVNNDGMHIVELPTDLYSNDSVSEDRPVDLLTSAVHVKEGGLVYDCAWYPAMNSGRPETCCWIASRQHEPIQLWDAFTGGLRCSYKGYDQFDEVEAALSLTFAPVDGATLYGGYKKSIKCFDTKVPGRETCSWRTKSTASCMAIASTMPQTILYGSWNRSISALDARSGECLSVGNYAPENSHSAGVTWIVFAPDTESLFVTGARKDPKLLFWDVRKLTQPVRTLQRTCGTNQRIYLDFSPLGQWLISGDSRGVLHAWNLHELDEQGQPKELLFPLHWDCLNGVSFHPHNPIMATASGQYHFPSAWQDTEDGEPEVAAGAPEEVPPVAKGGDRPKVENSLTMWWIGEGLFSDE
ncbi:telomerase Cajal body protein 1 homolog [Anopheles stephensi]|uniref:telomerase Cajal body protein 1 homolog n=1 Tax=Anopheles stephensi TaxID=30069 RepID=UPI001658738B|nr:telomerase Cajal body protein 1 homolog [Anopheles stephensi]